MLVNCNSCQKKFNVPASAITEAGRLLQCGSCGNKWTQYPIKNEVVKKEIQKKEAPKTTTVKVKQNPKKKSLFKKKKREIKLYSEEYLKKKHGLEIKDPTNNKKIKKNKNIAYSTNFFIYLITITIFIISLFGILNLTKDFVMIEYPFTEQYIYTLYEVLEILKVTIFNFIN